MIDFHCFLLFLSVYLPIYINATNTLNIEAICTRDKIGCVYLGRDAGWEIYNATVEYTHGHPHPPVTDSWKHSNTTLYLTLSSFRDKLCPITLYNAFTKAKHPHRLTVGVVQQNEADDIDCYDEYCRLMNEAFPHLSDTVTGDKCPYSSNIRMNKVSAFDAKGPTWARAKGSQMVENEDFCMQTDSHMDFLPDWDMHMMNMWGSVDNEYAILSTYVTDVKEYDKLVDGAKGVNNMNEVPHLCMVTYSGTGGLVRVWGTKCARNLPKPKLTNIIWGAGLSFSKCHADKKVPYDPHTPYIFDGEEYSRALRFWTWGYDIYTPHRVYVVHNYVVSQSDPKHFSWYQNKDNDRATAVEESQHRLRLLLGLDYDTYKVEEILQVQKSRYGLGDRRTLDQAIEFSGIDTKNRKSLGNKCGNLAYVPFVEHPFGASYLPMYDAITEEYMDVRDPGSVYYDKSSDVDRIHWIERVQKGVVIAAPASTTIVTDASNSGSSSSTSSSSGDVRHSNLLDRRIHLSNDNDGSYTGYDYNNTIFILFIAALFIAIMVLSSRRCHIGKGVYQSTDLLQQIELKIV